MSLALSAVLEGQKFPGKAFLLTFVEVCGIDLEHDPRWELAWNRLADQGRPPGPAAEDAELLRLENEELRQRLAEAECRAEAAEARIQNQLDRHPAVAREGAEEGWQDAFDPDVIRQWLRQAYPRAWFLHLAIEQETATGRAAPFMPASLVDSQFAALEPLHEEEAGLTVDGALPPEQILATAIKALAAAGRP